MEAINTSIFDILKCGPGPSSSHTIGPMEAAFSFRKVLNNFDIPKQNAKIQVKLYGSLSATGKGHGTPAAVIAGLSGYKAAECPCNFLHEIEHNPDIQYDLHTNAKLTIAYNDIIFADVVHNFPYSNTIEFSIIYENKTILHKLYYSVGGGFVLCEGEVYKDKGEAKYKYTNMRQLKHILAETGYTLPELILENEASITGNSRVNILNEMDLIIQLMLDSVERGLNAEGYLPGNLKVRRKAKLLHDKAKAIPFATDKFIAKLNAYAFAVSEENASGGVIVTAPTCGAAGLVPAIIYSLIHDKQVGSRVIRESLIASIAIAFLAKHNASIAGAEVGCQGEIGVASAIGAGLLAHSFGNSAQIVENAAEIALEHHLGLSCDPVGGFVQIPCIERNAVGALKAYNAALLASLEEPSSHQVSLDSVIAAMNETGREMNSKFKETSLGGLALSMVNC